MPTIMGIGSHTLTDQELEPKIVELLQGAQSDTSLNPIEKIDITTGARFCLILDHERALLNK